MRLVVFGLFLMSLMSLGVTTLRCERIPNSGGIIIVQPGDADDSFWDDLEDLFD